MVLEEEIHFSTPDAARDFVRLMKELGIGARIQQKAPLDIRLMFSGTYLTLTALVDDLAEKAENEEEAGFLAGVREDLTGQRDLIARAVETRAVGDRMGSSLIDIATGDRILEGDESEAEIESIIEEMHLTRLLHLNDMLEIAETGMVLKKMIDPDQAVLSLFVDEMPELDKELLGKHPVRMMLTAGDDEDWLVSIGTELIFTEDLSPVEEFFEDLGVDAEENALFFNRIQIKQILVSEILGLIRNGGKASREEICEEFSDRDIESGDDQLPISLNLSRTYIDAVIDDLKKAGILKGKDQKLRISI